MKMILLGVLSFFLLILGFLLWGSYPWSLSQKKHLSEILHVEPEGMVNVEERPSVIKVLTWNLGFLFGEGSEGPGYRPQDKQFYEQKLAQLVSHIHEWQPDIIFFQEIDFEASRSHDMDQALHVAQRAGYPYVATAVSWEANYIPFPYWPFSHHFGRMKSGGAVLSKYPILKNEVELFQKPLSQPWWYNLYYLHRYFQTVTIDLGDKKFKVVNLHLEAFDIKDREDQIKYLAKRVKQEKIDFVAGDFNMVPKSATKRSKFFNQDSYENDASYELMLHSQLAEVIPDEIYAKDESFYFTFPAGHPDRRLDYIFYQKELKLMKAEVVPSTVSDHLPLKASFQISSPHFNPYSQ